MAAEDIRFILSRIRPDAEWGWKGGDIDDASQVDWRDQTQREPTQAEYDAEQLVIDQEDSDRSNTDTGTRSRLSSTVGKQYTALTSDEKDAILERVLQHAGGMNEDGTIRDVDEWDPEQA